MGSAGAPRRQPRAPASPPPARAAVIAGGRRCARVRLIAGSGGDAARRCGARAGGTRGAAAPRSRQVGAGRAVAAVAPLRAAPAQARRASLLGTSTLRPRSLPPPRARPLSRGPAGFPPEVSAPRAPLAAPRPAPAVPAAPSSPALRPTSRSRRHGLGGTVSVGLGLGGCRPRALSLPAWEPGGSALSGSLYGRRRSPPLSARAHVRVRLCRAAPLSSGPGSGRFPCVLPSPTPWPGASVSPGFLSVSLSLSLSLLGYLPDFSCLSGVSVCLSSITVSLALRLSLPGFLFGPLSASVSDLSISLFRSLSPPAPHSLPSP